MALPPIPPPLPMQPQARNMVDEWPNDTQLVPGQFRHDTDLMYVDGGRDGDRFVSRVLERYAFYLLERDPVGKGSKTWTLASFRKVPMDETELIRKLERRLKSTKVDSSTVYKKLSDPQRDLVDRVVHDLQRYEHVGRWVTAHILPVIKSTGLTTQETTSIEVIMKLQDMKQRDQLDQRDPYNDRRQTVTVRPNQRKLSGPSFTKLVRENGTVYGHERDRMPRPIRRASDPSAQYTRDRVVYPDDLHQTYAGEEQRLEGPYAGVRLTHDPYHDVQQLQPQHNNGDVYRQERKKKKKNRDYIPQDPAFNDYNPQAINVPMPGAFPVQPDLPPPGNLGPPPPLDYNSAHANDHNQFHGDVRQYDDVPVPGVPPLQAPMPPMQPGFQSEFDHQHHGMNAPPPNYHVGDDIYRGHDNFQPRLDPQTNYMPEQLSTRNPFHPPHGIPIADNVKHSEYIPHGRGRFDDSRTTLSRRHSERHRHNDPSHRTSADTRALREMREMNQKIDHKIDQLGDQLDRLQMHADDSSEDYYDQDSTWSGIRSDERFTPPSTPPRSPRSRRGSLIDGDLKQYRGRYRGKYNDGLVIVGQGPTHRGRHDAFDLHPSGRSRPKIMQRADTYDDYPWHEAESRKTKYPLHRRHTMDRFDEDYETSRQRIRQDDRRPASRHDRPDMYVVNETGRRHDRPRGGYYRH